MKAIDEVKVRRWGSVDIIIAVAVVVIVKEWSPVFLRRLSLFLSNHEHRRYVGE